MTPIIPPDLIPIIFGKLNDTGDFKKELGNVDIGNDEAHQKAQEYTKDIMQNYVARGQESHNS